MCDPCQYCRNLISAPYRYDEPTYDECRAEDDDRMDGWEPNGTTPCPCFKPFFASDSLYEELNEECQYIWYLEDEARVRELTDEEKKEIARIERMSLKEVEELIREWKGE